MPSFETTRRIAHSSADMFGLVADVEQYPKFVPLCGGLRVMKREAQADGEMITAYMTVAYKLFSESFTSRVRLRPAEGVIIVDYLDGPFRRLDNRWTFTPLSETESRVKFFLDYEFRAKPLQMLMGSVFDRAFRKFADAFEARADEVYGRRRRARSHPPTPFNGAG
ncbi:MAG: type II toxin-antitoxin system RatA family toxin [Rhodomicrobium sp.]